MIASYLFRYTLTYLSCKRTWIKNVSKLHNMQWIFRERPTFPKVIKVSAPDVVKVASVWRYPEPWYSKTDLSYVCRCVMLSNTFPIHVSRALIHPVERRFTLRLSWSIEAARFNYIMIASLQNLVGISTTMLPMNLYILERFNKPKPLSLDFESSRGLVARCPSA